MLGRTEDDLDKMCKLALFITILGTAKLCGFAKHFHSWLKTVPGFGVANCVSNIIETQRHEG